MSRQKALGDQGEKLAQAFLLQKGFQMRESNYRYSRAEIDLILEKDDLLIFVEVKYRSRSDYGLPEESVSPRQQELILEAAENYILDTGWNGKIRFDIIAILKNGKEHNIEHLQDVFY